MNWASSQGHLKVVKYLMCALRVNYVVGALGYKKKCTMLAMDSASRNGHLEVVEYLHKYLHENKN
jgi:hypothetical protein